MLKNGRRGSINVDVTVTGQQGHVAYPHRALNPVPALMDILGQLHARKLDAGSEFFQPSNLEVTTIDVGNPTENMIPETARARFNIRFNVHHTGESLSKWIGDIIDKTQSGFDGKIDANSMPELSTSGGTSDARFISKYAPVAEFGLVGATMHQIDEHVAVDDIRRLCEIYSLILTRYFDG